VRHEKQGRAMSFKERGSAVQHAHAADGRLKGKELRPAAMASPPAADAQTLGGWRELK